MQDLILTKWYSTTDYKGSPAPIKWNMHYQLNVSSKETYIWGWWDLICEYQVETKSLWIIANGGGISEAERKHIIEEIENLFGDYNIINNIVLKDEKEFEEMSNLLLDTLLNVLHIERIDDTRCIKYDY